MSDAPYTWSGEPTMPTVETDPTVRVTHQAAVAAQQAKIAALGHLPGYIATYGDTEGRARYAADLDELGRLGVIAHRDGPGRSATARARTLGDTSDRGNVIWREARP